VHQFGITKKCLDTVDARYKHEEKATNHIALQPTLASKI